MRLENKVALVTGIGRGMGRATAILFAQEGAKVAINARQKDHLEETQSMIKSRGGQCLVVQGDVSSGKEAEGFVQKVVKQYGHIDILYSGAGGNFQPTEKLDDINEEFWNQTITNTVNSMYNLSKAVKPIMVSNGGGSIISIGASDSVRQEGNLAYGTAKSGILGLTKNLAREFYPDNIRVNCVAAGLFRGKLKNEKISPGETNLLRTGYPQDIAYASLFFASDESNWITGQVLTVDGGVDAGTRPLWEYEK